MYHHEEDETSFQLVDTGRLPKPMHQKSRPKFSQVSAVMINGNETDTTVTLSVKRAICRKD